MLSMNHRIFAEAAAAELKPDENCKGLRELLEWLISAVSERIKQMKNCSYASILAKELSYRERFGIVGRGLLWGLYPELRERVCKGLSSEEQTAFCRMYEEDTAHPPKLLPGMTAGEYYAHCAACFEALGMKNEEQISGKEWFSRKFYSRAKWELRELREDDAEWSMNPFNRIINGSFVGGVSGFRLCIRMRDADSV